MKRDPIEHELKIWPEYYGLVSSRQKPFELRKADRDFRPGDTIKFREYDPGAQRYTGEEGRARIQVVLSGHVPGLAAGYVALGIFFIGRAMARPVGYDYGTGYL